MEAFDSLKEQLAWLPTLQPSILGEPLTLYVVSTESIVSVISAILVSKAGAVGQRPVYYYSHEYRHAAHGVRGTPPRSVH